jgi:hypothetical protein
VREPNAPPEVVDRLVSTLHVATWIVTLARTSVPWNAREDSTDERGLYVVAQMRENEWLLKQLSARDPAFDAEPYRGDRVFVTDGEYAYCEGTGRDASDLLVKVTDASGEGRLETTRPDLALRLRRVAGALPAFDRTAPTDMDPGARERLRALGYAD